MFPNVATGLVTEAPLRFMGNPMAVGMTSLLAAHAGHAG
jgi:hypothetical protein